MALTTEQTKAVKWLTQRPVEYGRMLGFNKLTDLHNDWMRQMIPKRMPDDTLQAHRGSYKTTCISVVLPIIMIVYPNDKTLFIRKTNTDVQEVIAQVSKIMQADVTKYLVKKIWGTDLHITSERLDQMTTSLTVNDMRGTAQLMAMGTQGSITGKHFDRIFTDDIVNLTDRVSRAERDRTKAFYQELQNIKNRDGRIFNTGTPWHKDDAFAIMPPAKKYSCYDTGLMSAEEIEHIKAGMTSSLFAANYEMRHVAEDDVIFSNPNTGAEPCMVEQGICHIDASYGGEDFTAFTIARAVDGKFYIYGRMWHKHIDDVTDEIIALRKQFNAGRISVEDNGDKGYLGRDLRQKGERTHVYHESMNKYIKITSYLKGAWKDVVFVAGTDDAYLQQILDYNENAEHDDAPDSCACMIRELWRKKSPVDTNNYFL